MSLYAYNGIGVVLTRTLTFEMDYERDPSNTDVLWQRYTIRVEGLVTPDPSVFRGDTTTVLNAIKNALESPRREMIYQNAGEVLVSHTGPPGTADARLGPEPTPAVVRAMNSGTYKVECGCIVRKVQCDDTSPSRSLPPAVVSLRWSQAESFDQNWFSTLTTDGKLIVRSDLRTSADVFRPQATPAVPNGYIRTSSQYTLNPNGTELDFHYEDAAQDRLPPFPATKAEGSFTVHVEKGFSRLGRVEVRLEGPPGTDRKALMTRAMSICYNVLTREAPLGVPGGRVAHVVSGAIREDLFKPVFVVNMEARLSPVIAAPPGGALEAWFTNAGVAPPDITGGLGIVRPVPLGPVAIGPPTRTSLAGVLTALFRDPCLAE